MFMSQLTSNKEKTLAELRAKMSQLEQSTTDISDFVEASDTSFLKPNMSQKRESDNFTLQNTDISNANTDDTVTAKKETYKQLRHKITRLLSKREHSFAEISQKLSQQEFSTSDIHTVLDKFVENGIQSDARFTFHFVRNCWMKGQGLSRVKQALKAHNIDSSLLHQALDELDIDWYSKAYEVKCKKFGEEVETDWSKKQKQMRFLQYRGFSQDQISFAISEKPNLD
jgi:regulatory protein